VEAGRVEFKPAPLELGALCRRISEEILTATNHQNPIQLAVEALSESDAHGDENLLQHIFTNLLSNAIKYSPPGASVEFSVFRKEHEALFHVVDHGCGIPTQDQERLFQAFYRGKNTAHIPGTGLGLVIVKRCVTLHGGSIHCESWEGKGTTFVVTLPLFSAAQDYEKNTGDRG
jgi:signal transduction histidine kinase